MSSTENIALKLEFPEWETMSEDKKNIINFFLEDAVAQYFIAEVGGVYRGFCGNIVDRYYTSHVYGSNLSSLYFCAPLFSIFLFDQENLDFDYKRFYYNMIDCEVDENDYRIKKINTFFSLYDVISGEGIASIPFFVYDEHENQIPALSERVVVTPVINGEEVDDRIFKPSLIGDEEASFPDSIYKSVNIIRSERDSCKFYLRTSSFGIYNVSESIEESVYYKVGVFIQNLQEASNWFEGDISKYVLSKLKSDLFLSLYCGFDNFENPRIFESVIDRENLGYESEIFISFKDISFDDINSDFEEAKQIIPHRLTLHYCLEGGIEFILYMKLYNDDGTPYIKDTQILHNHVFNLFYKESSSGESVYVSDTPLCIGFIDQNVDQGFIPSPQPILEEPGV